MEKLLDQFTSVACAEKMPDCLILAKLDVIPSEITTQNELQKIIREFNAVSGWLTTQSANLMVDEWIANSERYGYVLSGELSSLERSLHIRQSRNGWRVTRFDEGAGDTFLAEDLYLSSVRSDKEFLGYRNYWQMQEGFGLRVAYSRFTGFNDGVQR